MIYPRRVDENHASVVAALRAAGWCVRSLATIGQGMPDLICAKPGSGNHLVEVKRDPKAKLTQDQVTFHLGWPVPVIVVTSPEDAVAQLQAIYSRNNVLRIVGPVDRGPQYTGGGAGGIGRGLTVDTDPEAA